LFGLPISRVQDVFMPSGCRGVPLSSAEIAGVLNLRAASSRSTCAPGSGCPSRRRQAADGGRVDLRGESYGLLIDQIGEVLRLPMTAARRTPSTSIRAWPKLAGGVHRPDGQLMVSSMSTASSKWAPNVKAA